MGNVTTVGTGVTGTGVDKERIGAAGNGDRWIRGDSVAKGVHLRAV